MKKLLALVLVLGLTSLASADLLLTVNGQPVTQGQITIAPSQTIELDLELTAGENVQMWDVTYMLSNAQAEFVTGSMTYPTVFEFPGGFTVPPTAQMVEISAANFTGGPAAGPAMLMQGLILHCLEATPVDLTLYVSDYTVVDGQEVEIGTVLGTLHITQIPEPVTIALLGLGSLFLRKRS